MIFLFGNNKNNLLIGDITGYLAKNNLTINQTKITPQALYEVVSLIEKGTISNNIAKKLLVPLMEEGGSAQEMVEKQGLSVISDEGALKEIIAKIIE